MTVRRCLRPCRALRASHSLNRAAKGSSWLGLVRRTYRGSTTFERYVNPNDTSLPDFAALAVAGTPKALDSYYKFRVINERQFAP